MTDFSSKTADKYAFFFHAIPPEVSCLTLAELHELVQSLWLTRHDQALEEEQSARRKGRPKSSRESQLEEMKWQDAEEYRTGLDLPDFTDAANLALFRKWDAVDVSYLYILHFIRICGEFPEAVHVARIGRGKPAEGLVKLNADDNTIMEVDEVSGL
jgi:translation machinery-associated protein 16